MPAALVVVGVRQAGVGVRRIPAFGRAGARPRRRRLLSRRRRAERLERQRRVCGALAPGRVVPQALAGAAVVEVRRAVALGLAPTHRQRRSIAAAGAHARRVRAERAAPLEPGHWRVGRRRLCRRDGLWLRVRVHLRLCPVAPRVWSALVLLASAPRALWLRRGRVVPRAGATAPRRCTAVCGRRRRPPSAVRR